VTRGLGSADRAVGYRGGVVFACTGRPAGIPPLLSRGTGPLSASDLDSNEQMDTTSVHEVRFLILENETATYGQYFLVRRPSSLVFQRPIPQRQILIPMHQHLIPSFPFIPHSMLLAEYRPAIQISGAIVAMTAWQWNCRIPRPSS